MKISLSRITYSALASLALMATSADAATILTFGQQQPVNSITSSVAAGTTTFASAGTPITVTNIGGITPPLGAPPIAEIFSFTSSAAVATVGDTTTQGGFSGTFNFGGQVVGTLTGGVLTTRGDTGNFTATNVTFTTLNPAILNQLGITAGQIGGLVGSLSLSLINVAGSGVSFTAQNSGLVSAVPEPASVVMMGMAVVAGLGGMGLRRVKASRA